MTDWRDERVKIATAGGRDGETRPVWLITGCSSGFGRAAAVAAIKRGFRVVATARDPRTLDGLAPEAQDDLLRLRLDLLDRDSIKAAVHTTLERFGRIDVLLNNAGIATIGAVEELTDELLRAQLETNLVGPLAVTREVLPAMRRQGSGRILQMSSMGGRCAFPGLGAYHASKFALEGASISLAQEVAPFGVHVTLIEPGDFRTPVLAPGRVVAGEQMSEYDQTVGQVRKAIAELDGTQPGDPVKAAEAMLAVAEADSPPLHLALGPDCYQRFKAQLEEQLAELEAWSHLTLSTDLDPGTAGPA